MQGIILVFESTNYTLQTESLLKEKGIKNQIMPTPREITVSCGLTIMVDEVEINNISNFMKEGLIKVRDIYKISGEGSNRIIEKIEII